MKQKTDILVTKEGLEELKGELGELVNKKRPKLVERLKNAREQGDLSENSDYESAREELSFIDGRIAELGDILHDVKVVRVSKKLKNEVGVGSIVTLHVDGTKHIYKVVGEWEADPADKKISHTSPIGKALMGKKVGDEIEVEAPAGKVVYKILTIK